MPYTSLNGHMFSFIDKEHKLSLRLPQKERDDFIAKYNSSLSVQHGTIMKEYVLVPEALFSDLQTFQKFFKISHDYVAGLKPKETKK